MPSIHFNYGNMWQWEDYPGQKVTFDSQNKIIFVNEGVTELSVKTDIYSGWKEWKVNAQESPHPTAYDRALTALGGDPITEDQNVGDTFFLENGWRIQPFASKEAYVLTVNGNIYTRETGGNPFLFAEGVSTSLIRSNIVDLIRVEALGVNITTADIEAIADSVWDEVLADHTTDNTTGERLGKLLTQNKYLALK